MTALLFCLFLAILCYGIVRVVTNSIKNDRVSVAGGIPWFAASFLALALFMSFTTVSSGSRSVVTRFGKINRVLAPGPHLVLPFVESTNTISVQTLIVRPAEDAASLDLQVVHTQVTLAYHFDPNHVDYIFTHFIDSSDNAVENKVVNPAILEAIKAVTAKYDAQSLISKRAEVRDGIDEFVKRRLQDNYIVPESVSITDFHFSQEFDHAIEAKVTAQQQAEKAGNDLTRIKVEAEQKVAAAEGEAQALKAQKEQITPELLQLRTIEMLASKWDGKLPENYYGGTAPLPMMEVLKSNKK